MTITSRDTIEAAWDASKWQFPSGYGFDDFMADTSGWDVWPVVVDGVLAGAILVNGPELHCCIKPEFFRRWATPGMYRRVMRHKALHGRLMTKVNVDHDSGREFVERFGFKCVQSVGSTLIYEMR